MNDSPFRRTHLGARVPVPADVFRGIEAVRLSGLTNMLDRPVVAEIAEGMGFDHAARWVRENRELYARAVSSRWEANSCGSRSSIVNFRSKPTWPPTSSIEVMFEFRS